MTTLTFSAAFGAAPFGAVAFGGGFAAAVPTPTPTVSVAGWSDGRPKRRYVVRKDGQLLVFSRAEDAYKALEDAQDEPQEVVKPAPPKKKKKSRVYTAEVSTKDIPEDKTPSVATASTMPALEVLDIEYIRELARRYNQARIAKELLFKAQYTALLELFERLQEEEEIEMLMLAV